MASFELKAKQTSFLTSSMFHFTPRILSSNVVSKLRSMRVYQPPRKKESRVSTYLIVFFLFTKQ